MNVIRSGLILVAALGVATRLHAQAITRVSVDSSGAQGNRASIPCVISGDGRLIVFQSYATNLVAGDTNGVTDIFVRDLAAGTTVRVSVDSLGAQANDESEQPAISDDGRFVAFVSAASNLVPGDTNSARDVFIRDLVLGVTLRASVDSNGAEISDGGIAPSLSADGRFLSFGTSASNLVPGDTNGFGDVFVRDMITGAIDRVSVDSSGGEGNNQSASSFDALSDDGQVVAFESFASNLVVGDTNGKRDVFFHDRTTGETRRVSVDSSGAEGNDRSFEPVLSGDGRFVAFHSYANNLVPSDGNISSDVFVHDRVTAVTERVSVDSTGGEAMGSSYDAAISADGRFVGFQSSAPNLVADDKNGVNDAFLHDLSTGGTERVSETDHGVEGNLDSWGVALSADGLTVAFESVASNFVSDDTNGWEDVFIRVPCPTVASWSNYGAGFPGALGVPSFAPRANPVLGTTLFCDLASSSGLYSVALLIVGLQRADIPSSWGGHLLVAPFVSQLLGVPPTGAVVGGDIPGYASFCGLVVDLQALELDPGAAKGVSFTQGLELVLGR